jgi:hypothetical protein
MELSYFFYYVTSHYIRGGIRDLYSIERGACRTEVDENQFFLLLKLKVTTENIPTELMVQYGVMDSVGD